MSIAAQTLKTTANFRIHQVLLFIQTLTIQNWPLLTRNSWVFDPSTDNLLRERLVLLFFLSILI